MSGMIKGAVTFVALATDKNGQAGRTLCVGTRQGPRIGPRAEAADMLNWRVWDLCPATAIVCTNLHFEQRYSFVDPSFGD